LSTPSNQELEQLFLDKLNPELAAEARGLVGLGDRLAAFEDRGRQAWPQLALGRGSMTWALTQRLERSPPRKGLEDWLEHVQAEDLHLALACAQGVVGAIEAFEATYKADLDRMMHRYQGPNMSREELLQRLREKLFVGSQKRGPKIADYAGQGYLQNWLRVTGARTFIDILRSTSSRSDREVLAYAPERVLEMPDMGDDLEVDFLKREYRAQFKTAFAQAATSLSSQERNLLRQHLVAGLSVHQLGRLYNVHASTAARRVNKARENLLAATRSGLMEQLQIDKDEFDSMMKMIRSRLDLSMSRLLKTMSGPGQGS
jgi:RNA polymerase sigma-70 factor (ECF subfamily)